MVIICVHYDTEEKTNKLYKKVQLLDTLEYGICFPNIILYGSGGVTILGSDNIINGDTLYIKRETDVAELRTFLDKQRSNTTANINFHCNLPLSFAVNVITNIINYFQER